MEREVIEKLKKNELEFQNKKYGKTSQDPNDHLKTAAEYEAFYLKPFHEGGAIRGELYKRTVDTVLAQDIRGKRVLDYACGRGDVAVYLSQKEAIVSGFDVSDNAIEVAKVKAKANQQEIDFQVMDASALDYPGEEFDFIIGTEALHHVIILPGVPEELNRILKPTGLIVFGENWGFDNPLFQLGRELTTLRKNNSSDRGEVILGRKIIDQYLAEHFSQIKIDPLSLLSMGKKYLRSQSLVRLVHSADQKLLNIAPFLKNYCGEVVIQLRK